MDDLENPIKMDWFHGKSHLEMDDLENPINMDWFHGKSHLEMDDLENPINMDWFHGKSHLEMDDFAMGNLQIHSNPPRPRFSSPQRPPQNLAVS